MKTHLVPNLPDIIGNSPPFLKVNQIEKDSFSRPSHFIMQVLERLRLKRFIHGSIVLFLPLSDDSARG